ncbi:MAG: indole-3-glycerol phosphate synthase TrpC [Persephonella sp.]|nr:MAG: indole-3-glycerol phosphate synthase TrpC [Persephonella sp.]
MNILEKIIQTKKKELDYYSPRYINYLAKRVKLRDKVRPFKYALKKKGINIIAEIKKASPSKGVIREDFNPIEIAQIYNQNGASAISVLTDKEYFDGDIDYLLQIRPFTTVPLLRKDFIIDERQILEAVAYGADSYLLIAKVLSRSELRNLIKYGNDFELEPLVEVHTLEEGLKALESGARIIGINNRNLETFEVDINITREFAPKLKEEGAEIIVSESGLETYEQLKDLKENYSVDAFLIGETLMRATDIGAKLRELLGKTKKDKNEENKKEEL